jgi:hypothetical protein
MIIVTMVDYFQLLQETTVGLIFDIQRASRAHDFPVPYAEASCRLELYRLLHTLVLEPHSTCPPPTQFAFHMLSKGRNDPSLEVSSKWGLQATVVVNKYNGTPHLIFPLFSIHFHCFHVTDLSVIIYSLRLSSVEFSDP